MKQGKIVGAYKMLATMYKTREIRFGTSSLLYNIKCRLEPYAQHQDEQEIAIANEMSEGMNPDGTYKMDMVQRGMFFKKLEEIQKTEVEYDYKPSKLELTEDEVKLLGISGEVIDVLNGIITIIVDGKTAADFTGSDSE